MNELERLFRSSAEEYRQVVSMILRRRDDFRGIPLFRDADDPVRPYWYNAEIPVPDAAALYAFVAEMRPSRYVEIGSGHSTRFAAKAIADHSPHTSMLTIDPNPPEEARVLSDWVIHSRLQDVPLETFTGLEEGDIVYLNGSHVSHMHSDVTRLFLHILPGLGRGVLVQVRDVFLPDEYPRELGIDRGYNEQYVLAAYLLGGAKHVKVIFPCHYVLKGEWSQPLCDAWDDLEPHRPRTEPGFEAGGQSFWMRTA